MLLDMLVLLDSILQMQLFQINQSEDSSKITIMSDTTCSQLYQRPITSASNYNRITLVKVYIKRASIRGQIGDVVEDRCCHKIDNYFTDCTFKIVLMRTTMRQLLFVIFAKYLQICDPDIFANIDITIYQADIKSIL